MRVEKAGRDSSLKFLPGLPMVLAILLLAAAAYAADPPTAELEGPPIERDTIKKAPGARVVKLWAQAAEDKGEPRLTPEYYMEHFDDFRKMFWQTYPKGEEHETAREAFAQALFIKDIHYLQADLFALDELKDTPFANADIHQDTAEGAANRALAQMFSSVSMDGHVNPDGGIPKTAMLQFVDWVKATRKALKESSKNSIFDPKTATSWKIAFQTLTPDYCKACNFGGKEYQAYLVERDMAEFSRANKVPAGFDNKQNYGAFLYYRWGEFPIHDALNVYHEMAIAVPDRNLLENAAGKILDAPKTPAGMLFTHVAEPYKLSPSGEKMVDYDMPTPPGVLDVYSNPLTALQKMVTQDDNYSYLLLIIQDKYLVNRIPVNEQGPWAFSVKAAQALYKAFGKEEVLGAAHLVRTATKRFYKGTIMDPKAIGATRNYPFEAFQDILARKNPKGYVLTALMFGANVEDPASVDADAAYKTLVASAGEGGEKKLLDDAAKLALEKPNLASKNELGFIKRVLGGEISLEKPAAGKQFDNPDYLAWKNFPDNVRVSYVIRGWKHDPRHPDQFTEPSTPSIRYTLSIKSRTPDLIVLWDTDIVYDYPSGNASKPHDTEVGYAATRTESSGSAGGPSRTRGGIVPGKPSQPVVLPITDSGEETLNVAGRSIATHWTSTTRISGTTDNGGMESRSVDKIWTSDEIPGGLVRKTEERTTASGLTRTATGQLRETVLESFQGFTPGTVAAAGSPPPGPPSVPAPATQPTADVPTVAPTPAVPTSAPVVKRPGREPLTPADIATQKELMKRYVAAINRKGQLGTQLDGGRRRGAADAPKLPPEIAKARTDVDGELAATPVALRNRDYEEAQKQIQAAEDNLAAIEQFLKPTVP